MTQDDIILQVEGLKKQFGPVHAVEQVSLCARRGQVFGFLGPNGAGKTTTIGMILGLLWPTAGSISLFGEKITPTRNAPLRRVGSLVGAPALVPYLSARENLRLVARLSPGVTDQRIDESLERVGLAEIAHRKTGPFSTGMKQRLGLAMALLHRPELLVLDEPTNGMDPGGMREIRSLLRELAGQGVSIFLSSHLLHEVEQICDYVAVLHKGRLAAEGPVASLLNGDTTVRVRVENPAEAVRLLAELPGARRIQQDGAYVTLSGVESKVIVVHLVNRGAVPSEVINEKSDLESLFMELTQSEI